MSASLNRAQIIGHLGRDPETRAVGETSVCSMSIATTETRKGKDGKQVDTTEWHRVIAWGRTGEVCQQYLRKGSKAFAEGRIQYRKWTAKDGTERVTTEIVADRVILLDSKPSSAARPDHDAGKWGPGHERHRAGRQRDDDSSIPF